MLRKENKESLYFQEGSSWNVITQRTKRKKGGWNLNLNYIVIFVGMAVSRKHQLGVSAVKMNIYRDYNKLNNRRFEEENKLEEKYLMGFDAVQSVRCYGNFEEKSCLHLQSLRKTQAGSRVLPPVPRTHFLKYTCVRNNTDLFRISEKVCLK
jgi:hypothetical protein